MEATVVVLGELARSPRMQHHALALAEAGARVRLVGFGGKGLDPLLAASGITIRALGRPRVGDPRRLPRPLYVLYSFAKLARLTLALGSVLLRGRMDLLLVQTPPALPTLAVAWLVARFRRCRLVADWHNLGTPLVERTLGTGAGLASAHRRLEFAFGRRMSANLCVSQALQRALAAQGIPATVFYDRPRSLPGPPAPTDGPVLIVSPTGWTEEEDFEMLLAALDEAEAGLAGAVSLTPLRIVLTGRGPLRLSLEARLNGRSWRCAEVHTAWFEPEDYARRLSGFDAGLSLHRSFSGLDLAMKVEDLIGAGLPVLALEHGAIREQLPPGTGGWLVANAHELALALQELARGGREGEPLRRLRRERAGTPRRGADDEWRASAWPVLREP